MENYIKITVPLAERPRIESDETRKIMQVYNNSKRIERAKELLIHYNLTPIEISYQLNYNSLEEFVNQFKSRVGLAPEHFKQLRARDNLLRK